MKAVCCIRPEPHYRRDAFERGLRRAGYNLTNTGWPNDRRDILVLWNRQLGDEAVAQQWERAGGTVLVVENGYAGRDESGRQLYAIAAGGHNGSGWFPEGDEDRFSALGIRLQPWAEDGRAVLICGQRGIGSTTMRSPPSWHNLARMQVRTLGHSLVIVRPHPGRHAPATPLALDLRAAAVCVIWSTSCGVQALAAGVPVVYGAPHWILEGAATRDLGSIQAPRRDDDARLRAFHRMAHAQWTTAEIETGEPFARFVSRLKAVKC